MFDHFSSDTLAKNSIFSGLSNLNDFTKRVRAKYKSSIPSYIENNYNDALSSYCNYATQYIANIQATALSCFYNPLNNFIIVGKTLMFLPNLKINFINLTDAFQKLGLPFSPDGRLEKKLINSLKRYLNHFIPIYYRTFYKYFYDNYTKTAKFSGNLLIPFYEPSKNFFTINGNLFIMSPIDHQFICLSSSNIRLIFKEHWKIPFPKDFKLLKQLLEGCKKDDMLPSYSRQSSENPYHLMIHDKINNNNFEFKYCAVSKNFIVSLAKDDDLLFWEKSNFIYTNAIAAPKLTLDIAQFFFNITKGDMKLLDLWAALFANIASPEYLTPKLFIINCNDSCNELLYDFLDLTFYNIVNETEFSMPIHNLKELVMPSYIPHLCSQQASGKKFFYITDLHNLYNDEDIKYLKNLIKGKPVSYKDDLLGKISYINNLPIICIANTHKELTYLKNNFPHVEIPFYYEKKNISNSLNTDSFDTDSFDTVFFEWFRIKLPLYGLQCKAIPSEEIQNNHSRKIIKQDDVLNEFFRLCCIVKKDTSSFTTAEDLYQAYLYFYSRLYPGNPLGKIEFNKILKQRGTFEYKRPHKSRTGPNPYAFMGIELKENFQDLVDESVDHTFSSPNMKLFYDNLLEIDNSVLIDYDALPRPISTTNTPNVYAERY